MPTPQEIYQQWLANGGQQEWIQRFAQPGPTPEQQAAMAERYRQSFSPAPTQPPPRQAPQPPPQPAPQPPPQPPPRQAPQPAPQARPDFAAQRAAAEQRRAAAMAGLEQQRAARQQARQQQYEAMLSARQQGRPPMPQVPAQPVQPAAQPAQPPAATYNGWNNNPNATAAQLSSPFRGSVNGSNYTPYRVKK